MKVTEKMLNSSACNWFEASTFCVSQFCWRDSDNCYLRRCKYTPEDKEALVASLEAPQGWVDHPTLGHVFAAPY